MRIWLCSCLMYFWVLPVFADNSIQTKSKLVSQCENFLKTSGESTGNLKVDFYYLTQPKQAEAICDRAGQFDSTIWYKLGESFRGGEPEKAKIYFKKAASKGVSEAWRRLRWVYQTSEIAQQAKEGDPTAQALMGQNLFDYQHYKESAIWFAKAAKQGEPLAKAMLGWLYVSGMGVEKNIDKGMRLLIEALRKGGDDDSSVSSIFSMGFMPNLPYKNEAYQLLVERYKEGPTDKWYMIADFISQEPYQLDTPENKSALFWYRKAAMAKDSEAAYQYFFANFLLETAKPGTATYQEAIDWLKKADSDNFDPAHLTLLELGEINEEPITTFKVEDISDEIISPSWLALAYNDGTILPIAEWKDHKFAKPTLVESLLKQGAPSLSLPKFIMDDVTLSHPKKIILDFSNKPKWFPFVWESLTKRENLNVDAVAQVPTSCDARWGFIQHGKHPYDPTSKDYIIDFSEQKDIVTNANITPIELGTIETTTTKGIEILNELKSKVAELIKPYKKEKNESVLSKVSIQEITWHQHWVVVMADIHWRSLSVPRNQACPDGRFVGWLRNGKLINSEFDYAVGCDSKSGWYNLPIETAFVVENKLFTINSMYSYGGQQHVIWELGNKVTERYDVDTSRGCE